MTDQSDASPPLPPQSAATASPVDGAAIDHAPISPANSKTCRRRETSSNFTNPSYAPSDSHAPLSAPPSPREPDHDPLFDKFWSVYPRKGGKGAARRQWAAALRRGMDAEAIIAAAERYRDDPKRDPRFTKYPQGWLNDERYNDEPASAAKPAPAIAGPGRDSTMNDEQLLQKVIILAADQEHPINGAVEIIRVVLRHRSYRAASTFPFVPAGRGEELAKMAYPDYLLTPEWQQRRTIMLDRAGRRCQVCNRSESLHVHHRTYERRGVEEIADLIVLCEDCHGLYHGKGRLATEIDVA